MTGYLATLRTGDHEDLAAVIIDPPLPGRIAGILECMAASGGWVFDEILSERWGRLVFCSRVFSALRRGLHDERPRGFRFTIHDSEGAA